VSVAITAASLLFPADVTLQMYVTRVLETEGTQVSMAGSDGLFLPHGKCLSLQGGYKNNL
jgi:hypothetical protein